MLQIVQKLEEHLKNGELTMERKDIETIIILLNNCEGKINDMY